MKASLQPKPMYCSRDYYYSSRFSQQYEKPTLILSLLVLTGLCTIVIGILFIWYKRKTSFTTYTMGNILKLIPPLKEKIPTLDSLLPILSEQAPPQNAKNALTTVAVP